MSKSLNFLYDDYCGEAGFDNKISLADDKGVVISVNVHRVSMLSDILYIGLGELRKNISLNDLRDAKKVFQRTAIPAVVQLELDDPEFERNKRFVEFFGFTPRNSGGNVIEYWRTI